MIPYCREQSRRSGISPEEMQEKQSIRSWGVPGLCTTDGDDFMCEHSFSDHVRGQLMIISSEEGVRDET